MWKKEIMKKKKTYKRTPVKNGSEKLRHGEIMSKWGKTRKGLATTKKERILDKENCVEERRLERTTAWTKEDLTRTTSWTKED